LAQGFTGKILRVNLTDGTTSVEELDPVLYRRYLGGGALATYFLLKEMPPGVDPLGPDNVLVFMCSILTGTPIPGFSRYTVAAKSPLTEGFAESEAGGFWGPELKWAGFDGIIIKGKSPKPVYLWIKDGECEIRDASHIWGKTTGEAEQIIRDELGDKRIRIAQTGPGGENLVRYACILNNVKHANGRTGLGAVMGSKNLRAVAVRGTQKLPLHDEEGVRNVTRWFAQNWRDNPRQVIMHNLGTSNGVLNMNAGGILPTKNFRTGTFEHADKISGQAMVDTILIEREGCYACPVRCKRVVDVKGEYDVDPYYGGPEYETIGSLGCLCCIGDLPAIAKGSELCNKYGIDTISTGVAIAFAMECYEEGLLTKEDTGGIDLRFGNADAMLAMIEQIAFRKGLGDILAEGVARAAEKIGKGAEKFAMHVKKQELPMHEPRGKKTLILAYAVSPTGADHMENPHDGDFASRSPAMERVAPLGFIEPVEAFDLSHRKVRQFVYLQKIWSLYNSLGVCTFVAAPVYTLTFEKLIEALEAATGWKTSLWELMKVAERADTMARCFNVREGFTRDDDTLPDRIFGPLEGGALEGVGVDRDVFQEMLSCYYGMVGWDPETGVPTKARLAELELDWIELPGVEVKA